RKCARFRRKMGRLPRPCTRGACAGGGRCSSPPSTAGRCWMRSFFTYRPGLIRHRSSRPRVGGRCRRCCRVGGSRLLISPTEPPAVRALGTTSSTPELYGCDILIVANKTRTGVQRKKFPEDLVASLADGRLYSQLPKMAALD